MATNECTAVRQSGKTITFEGLTELPATMLKALQEDAALEVTIAGNVLTFPDEALCAECFEAMFADGCYNVDDLPGDPDYSGASFDGFDPG